MSLPMKRSRQRDAILAYLKTRTDHPTAEAVYTALRQTMPHISLGTVYRNLSLLAERHIIIRISSNGKTDHFDANVAPHPHFICRRCDCVQDIRMPMPQALATLLPADFPGKADGCLLLYYGICQSCLETLSE